MRLEEDNARICDLRQVCLHAVVGTAAPYPVAEGDNLVGGEIRRRVLDGEEVSPCRPGDLLGNRFGVSRGGRIDDGPFSHVTILLYISLRFAKIIFCWNYYNILLRIVQGNQSQEAI